MIVDGQTLYSVVAPDIAVLELTDTYASGEVVQKFTDPTFKTPTTIAKVDSKLLVVNAQFAARASGSPELPFAISSVTIP